MAAKIEAYSLRQIEQICHQQKVQKRGWYHLHRRLSTPITWLLYRCGVKPNVVSASMLWVGLAGIALLVPTQLVLNVAGLLLIYLAFLLDKVDGDLARLRKCIGPQAMILDFAYHRITLFAFYAALGCHAYFATQDVAGLAAGFVAGFLANYAQDAQLYPYRIYAQKLLSMQEAWQLKPVPQQRREFREKPIKVLKVFTSQLLMLACATVLLLAAPQWLIWFLVTAIGALLVFVVVQHYILFSGGMEAELAYIDSCLHQHMATSIPQTATEMSAKITDHEHGVADAIAAQ